MRGTLRTTLRRSGEVLGAGSMNVRDSTPDPEHGREPDADSYRGNGSRTAPARAGGRRAPLSNPRRLVATPSCMYSAGRPQCALARPRETGG